MSAKAKCINVRSCLTHNSPNWKQPKCPSQHSGCIGCGVSVLWTGGEHEHVSAVHTA